MIRPSTSKAAAIAAAGIVLILLIFWRDAVWGVCGHLLSILSDPQRTQSFVQSFGSTAPLVFVAIQVTQVVIAPIPGELTGFIGGYLFGALAGFLYSSAALAAGSLINFGIGRRLGRGFVTRHVSSGQLKRFDRLFKDRGIVVVFILFLFPGFPKDTFCLFLGLTTLPLRLLLLLAAVGRMPGTLMLSLQGAAVFSRDYRAMILVALVSLAAAVAAYRYRNALIRWAERSRRA